MVPDLFCYVDDSTSLHITYFADLNQFASKLLNKDISEMSNWSQRCDIKLNQVK